jgi:hypothetical protein
LAFSAAVNSRASAPAASPNVAAAPIPPVVRNFRRVVVMDIVLRNVGAEKFAFM